MKASQETWNEMYKFDLSEEELKNSGRIFIPHDQKLWNEQERFRNQHKIWKEHKKTKSSTTLKQN